MAEDDEGGHFVSGLLSGLRVSLPIAFAVWLLHSGFVSRADLSSWRSVLQCVDAQLARLDGRILAVTSTVVLGAVIAVVYNVLYRRAEPDGRSQASNDCHPQRRKQPPPPHLPAGWAMGTMEDGTRFYYNKHEPQGNVQFEPPRPAGTPSGGPLSVRARPPTDAAQRPLELRQYGITAGLGCLYPPAPPTAGGALVPPALAAWEAASRRLPRLVVARAVRRTVRGLPYGTVQQAALAATTAAADGAAERVLMVLGFLAHAFHCEGCPQITGSSRSNTPGCAENLVISVAVHAVPYHSEPRIGGSGTQDELPPWLLDSWAILLRDATIARLYPRRPGLCYSSLVLCNWAPINPSAVAVGSLSTLAITAPSEIASGVWLPYADIYARKQPCMTKIDLHL